MAKRKIERKKSMYLLSTQHSAAMDDDDKNDSKYGSTKYNQHPACRWTID